MYVARDCVVDACGTDRRQLSLADFARLPRLLWATSHAVYPVLLLTGPIQMVRVMDTLGHHLLTAAGFIQRSEVASWVNVAAMVATMFCLLSFFILPVKWTHRHYLSICLAIAVAFMEVCGIQFVVAARSDIHSSHS